MVENWPTNLQELTLVTIVFRMTLAIFIGGIIGIERDIKHRAAGVRTHILVCLGAAIIMMTNEYIFEMHPDAGIDITRMGAQVVSGIGFIGAGTILVTNENRVQGLTTAAGLWAAASIGLAVGIGFYEVALAGGIAIIGIIILLRPLKHFIQSRMDPMNLTLLIHSQNGFKDFLQYTSSIDVKISNIEIQKEFDPSVQNEPDTIFMVTISLGKQVSREDFLEKLTLLENIEHVVEIKD